MSKKEKINSYRLGLICGGAIGVWLLGALLFNYELLSRQAAEISYYVTLPIVFAALAWENRKSFVKTKNPALRLFKRIVFIAAAFIGLVIVGFIAMMYLRHMLGGI